jgi:hypothetical protein
MGKKVLWEILIPVYSNRGIKFPLKYHQEWDKKARKISGGLTILSGAKGHWFNPSGKLLVEEMIPVRIFCSKKEIELIAKETIKYYSQEAIMYYCVSSEVFIKHKKDFS